MTIIGGRRCTLVLFYALAAHLRPHNFWALDFNWQPGKPSTHDWQDYRTRKDRSLKTVSDEVYTYPALDKYTACLKVVHTSGCNTSITLDYCGGGGVA
ncbi:hypothetical protein [Leptolyngbya sp. 7M]|uniref:hypothetical protein n=1 Tax=Leptolyngbya sp. 7M TaxID=2812896 RepID=UPI001B8C868E|nr:hypothetical protein [Leptolyngbya sp. 7M]QYO63348.1 hypothetical protein JVX88_26025 [Leptolyngbya sp. 7M]